LFFTFVPRIPFFFRIDGTCFLRNFFLSVIFLLPLYYILFHVKSFKDLFLFIFLFFLSFAFFWRKSCKGKTTFLITKIFFNIFFLIILSELIN
jgi:TctA family transporter